MKEEQTSCSAPQAAVHSPPSVRSTFLNQTYKFTVKKPFHRIFLAVDSTFVTLHKQIINHDEKSKTKKTILTHLNAFGKILWKYTLKESKSHQWFGQGLFAMLNDRQCIHIDPKADTMTILYLQKQKIMTIRQCCLSNFHLHEIITFEESQIFCLRVSNNYTYEDHSLYYDSKNLTHQNKVIAYFKQERFTGSKVDNYSKVAQLQVEYQQMCCQQKSRKYIQERKQHYILETCHVQKDNAKAIKNTIKIEKEHFNLDNDQYLRLNMLFQLKNDHFLVFPSQKMDDRVLKYKPLLIVPKQYKDGKRYYFQHTFYKHGEYHYDFPNNNIKNKLLYGNLIILAFKNYHLHLGPTYLPYEDDTTSTNLVVMNWSTEQIVAVEVRGKQNEYDLKSFTNPAGHKNVMMITEEKANKKTKQYEIKVTLIQFDQIRSCYMHWLLHLNEDFDDDLLQDSIEILI